MPSLEQPHHTTRAEPHTAIAASDLIVIYRRYRKQSLTLKDYLVKRLKGTYYDSFVALKNFSLTVQSGESIGIIGPNGSGKSTLLKVIAGVLPPAGGTIHVNGKVAPLLELGAGFKPDLTGRENIYLNGAIFGLSRAQLEERIPRIIEFAGIGDFIDAPLTTYSSGMKARLGFAVSTDVDADILLLDETLAVGDAEFKAKAQARTEAFFHSNKTVVLVSHSEDNIRKLCTRAVYIKGGEIQAEGQPEDVLQHYREDVARNAAAK